MWTTKDSIFLAFKAGLKKIDFMHFNLKASHQRKANWKVHRFYKKSGHFLTICKQL